MKKMKIKIINISPLLLSSGNGVGSLIDTDIVWDDYGLPLFSARRLKGLLRESAVEVVQMFEKSHMDFPVASVDVLFGNGEEDGDMKIYDAYLEDYDSSVEFLDCLRLLNCELFSVENVREVLTHVRQQTAIGNDGISNDNSLRSSRTLNPNFIFESDLYLLNASEENVNLLALSCRNLRRAGLNRNRGFGEIVVRLFDCKEELSAKVLKILKAGVQNV